LFTVLFGLMMAIYRRNIVTGRGP